MKDRLHEALQQMEGHRTVLEARKRCAMCALGKDAANAELFELEKHIAQLKKELSDD